MQSPSLKPWQAYCLLALANLFWAGNWVVGRALRETFAPSTLNTWRWLLAALILAPFALPLLRGKWHLLRRHALLLTLLAATGFALFQWMVYVGLQGTTAVNAVLISASGPLFVMLWSWILEREATRMRQVIGMLVSFAGIAAILGRGDPLALREWTFHPGDLWILLAMPIIGLYSVLLKRVPGELRGSAMLFSLAVLTVPLMGIGVVLEPPVLQLVAISWPALLGLGYTALFASVVAFSCWNRAVVAVGANKAGLSLPLMPAFGTVLALVFLGEELHLFHVAGIATILAGVVLATRQAPRSATPPADAPASSATPVAAKA